MKTRKLKANLGRTFPAHGTNNRNRKFVVRGDAKALHFRRLWAREGSVVTVNYGDILDFALARKTEWGGKEHTMGFCGDGLWIRQTGEACVRIVSFDDLRDLVNGQGFLPS